ncbi:S26 family signal peptidase [Stieleria sp. ICT_E10.1]|uniref:S26 family signal peptidase n=1 Tax=Stieleria sedimenti TaxID=2976331 RepID=UPI00217F4756|nr:S26 family signal peptidase [Stieleria sedimenti]MCS7467936.1 S26 family signal peptidase [Stieleria sedimenti]
MKPLARRSLPIVAILIGVVVFSVAYRWGRRSAQPNSAASDSALRPANDRASLPSVFRIAGDSMAPTLVDGDVCQLADCGTLQIGDVVAIRWGGKRHVKRVAAVGGDVLDRAEGRLTVGGWRLEDLLAERDADEFLTPALVPVSSQPNHWSRDAGVPSRLVYGHRNTHQAGRITPVMDDYPINQTVRRVLNRVDRLVVEIRAKTPTVVPEAPLRVFFFDDERSMVSTTSRGGWARYRDAVADHAAGTEGRSDQLGMLDAAHPVAVDLDEQQASRYTLRVYREIEYRDDRPSGNVNYPVTLGDEEVFVVGDNVPVSVDSRALGPLPRTAIEGQILKPSR